MNVSHGTRSSHELIDTAFGPADEAVHREAQQGRPGPPRAVKYLRRSVQDSEDQSIGVQNEKTGIYIKEIGAFCDLDRDVFLDRNRTGDTVRDRDGLIAMLERI
jgi:hypothetical protein